MQRWVGKERRGEGREEELERHSDSFIEIALWGTVEEGEEKSRPARRESQGKEGLSENLVSESTLAVIPSCLLCYYHNLSTVHSAAASRLSCQTPLSCYTAYIDQGYPDVTAKLSAKAQ
jgi:hypothetical protein